MALTHLHLKVADVQKTISFYKELFGFKEKVKFSDDFYFLQDESGFDMAIAGADGKVPLLPKGVHFGFRVESKAELTQAFDKAKASYPKLLKENQINDHDKWADFNCDDPDGYPIQVYWDPNLQLK